MASKCLLISHAVSEQRSALQIILSSTKFVSGRNGEIKKRCHDTLVTRVPLCYHHVWPVLSSNLNMWYDTNRAVGML